MLKLSMALAAALLLGGCATLRTVDTDVSTFSQWPPGRAPGTDAFERLPSQLAKPEEQDRLEAAARGALETAGFTAAADPAAADVRVQLAARLDAVAGGYYADPFGGFSGTIGWGRPFGYRRSGASFGFGFRFPPQPTVYERQVMMLLRDRQTGQALFEARASSESSSAAFAAVLPALFQAALKDFPSGGVNPRRISVDLPPP